jgi:drug/metabolite transporter (DMT)-like permease
VPAIVIPIVGLAAVLHAAWNVILKTSGDPLLVSMRLTLIGVAISLPIVGVWYAATGWPSVPPVGLALALVSGIIEAAYFVSLSAAYRRGDLSVVYPVARGVAPLIAVAIGLLLLGETLAPPGWLGVACLLIGVILVSRPWLALSETGADAALGFALLTGVTIAAYSAVDRVGVQLMSPIAYGVVLFTVAAGLLAGWVAFFSRPLDTGRDASWTRSAVAGIMAVLAYVLVLVALSIAPLVVVAPLRESAIVLVTGWGAIRLAEATSRADTIRRIGAAILLVGGIALLIVGG